MEKYKLVCKVVIVALFIFLFGLVAEAGKDISGYQKELGLMKVKDSKGIPSTELSDLEGNAVSLEKFRGDVIFMNFWSMYCHVCLGEREKFQQLHEEFADDGLRVVDISLDKGLRDKLAQVVEKKGLTTLVLIDEERALMKEFRVNAVPVTFIISREGIIIDKALGAKEWLSEAGKAYVRALLAWDP